MNRVVILGACLLAALGCGGEGTGTGGSGGTGGTAATGGTSSTGGTGGTAATGGMPATGGTGGTGGSAGSGGMAGTGGSAGTGGMAGAGGSAGAGGTGGNAGAGGSGGTTTGPAIECDPIVRVDDYEADTGGPVFLDFASSGNHAAAIWNERGGGFEGVTVARYDFATDEWSTPFDVFLETNPGFTPFTDIAIDVDGDVTALIREVDAGDQQLWTRTYDATGDTWGTSEEADSDTYGQFNGWALRYDRDSGEPILAFLTPSMARTSVFFTRRGPTGWTGDVLLEQNNSDSVKDLEFAVNDVGQALLLYSIDVGGTTPTLYVLPYDNGDFRRDGSNALSPFSTTITSLAGVPAIDLDDTGKGVLLINDSFSTERMLYTVDIDIDADTFGAQELIHDTESPASIGAVDVARSESGVIVAAWGQKRSIGGQTYPWATAYDGTWITPREVGTTSLSGDWQAVIDASGTATVAWASGFPGAFATRNTGPGGAFIEPQEITGSVQGGSGTAAGAANDSGDFLAVWQENRMVRAARCRNAAP
ncbi:MAG: hypothetical protein AAF436_20780 [Myxococcota bacterium]